MPWPIFAYAEAGNEAERLRGAATAGGDRSPPIMAKAALVVEQALLELEPPPYPVRLPLAPITRWQGSTRGMGLRPLAKPTARQAFGLPIRTASSP